MIGATKSFIRYPGSKAKLTKIIHDFLPDNIGLELLRSNSTSEYIEPFVGAGAVVASILPILSRDSSIVLNDKDYWIVCLLRSVIDEPGELCRRISDFVPSGEAFYRFKERDGDPSCDPVEAGFMKLALHQISFSGLGVKAGGPIGGRSQKNELYNPQCRWRPSQLKSKILDLHRWFSRFRSVEVSCKDFGQVLSSAKKNSFVYLDPPYYEKGPELYKHSMTDDDHARLAELLRRADYRWVLSYDDHPRIRDLYSFARFNEVTLTYTTATAKDGQRPKNHEVIITPA